jgi:hypothetical protein
MCAQPPAVDLPERINLLLLDGAKSLYGISRSIGIKILGGLLMKQQSPGK